MSRLLKSHPTGSYYICNPPVTTTDIDRVVLAEEGYWEDLTSMGFEPSPTQLEYDSLGSFISWRRGTDNYIVTTDPSFYALFVAATEIAKQLNLKDKESRVALFQGLLYGKTVKVIQQCE